MLAGLYYGISKPKRGQVPNKLIGMWEGPNSQYDNPVSQDLARSLTAVGLMRELTKAELTTGCILGIHIYSSLGSSSSAGAPKTLNGHRQSTPMCPTARHCSHRKNPWNNIRLLRRKGFRQAHRVNATSVRLPAIFLDTPACLEQTSTTVSHIFNDIYFSERSRGQSNIEYGRNEIVRSDL